MAIVGPVFWKELIEAARRKRYALLRCVIPALFLFVVFVESIESASRQSSTSQPVLKQQARAGREMFEVWTVFTVLTIGLAAPLLVGGLVAAERERGSLDLLFTTDLSNREIILGKAASRVAILWLLLFGSAPALEFIAFLGGVGFEMVFGVLLLTLSGAVMVCSVGIYYSTVTRRPWIAIVRTFFFFGLWWFIIPFGLVAGHYALAELFGIGSASRPPTSLAALHLPMCLISQFEPWMAFGYAPLSMALINALFSWSVSGLFLFATHLKLRESPSRHKSWILILLGWPKRVGVWIARPILRGAERIVSQRAVRAFSFSPKRQERMLDRQPVAWRNLRAAVFDPDGYLTRIQRFLVICLVAFLGLGTIAWGPPRAGEFVAFILVAMMVLHGLTAVLAAGTISRERERGSLDLLRMTMLTPHQILAGNAVGAVRAVKLLMWAVAGLMAYTLLFRLFSIPFAAGYAVVLAAGTLMVLVQSMLVSSAAPNSMTAIGSAVIVGFLWWISPGCFEDGDVRGWAIGVAGALIPIALLPIARRPRVWEYLVAGTAALAVFVSFGARRWNDTAPAMGTCIVASLLSLRWLGARFPIPRLVAACSLSVLLPLAVGLTLCTLIQVRMGSIDHVLFFPYYIVEIEQISSFGWRNGEEWAPFIFLASTFASTLLLYRINVRAFAKLTAVS